MEALDLAMVIFIAAVAIFSAIGFFLKVIKIKTTNKEYYGSY